MSTKLSQQASGFAIQGELNHQTVPVLFKQSLGQSDGDVVELNLSAVDKVDSAGVALLLHWTQSLQAANQKLLIKQAKPQLMQMIDILAVQSQLHFE